MQTSTPVGSKRRRQSKNIGDLNISPVPKQETENASKKYSKRERKPRKWDDFETETSTEHKKNQTCGVDGKTDCDLSNVGGDKCDTEVDTVEILIDEQDTPVSVAKISPVEKKKTDRKVKGKRTPKKVNDHIAESSPSTSRDKESVSKRTSVQYTVNTTRLSERKHLHDRHGSQGLKTDDSSDPDKRLTPNEEELLKLRDTVESRRNTKYIDKRDRVMKQKQISETKEIKRKPGALTKLMSDSLARTELDSNNIKKETKQVLNDCKKNESKHVSLNSDQSQSLPANTSGGEDNSNNGISEHDCFKQLGNSKSKQLENSKHVQEETDVNVNPSDSYKTPVKRRGRKKVTERENTQKNETEDSSESRSVTRKRVYSRSSLNIEAGSTDTSLNTSQGSKRKGRKRKEINYVDLDNGDLDTEVKDARGKAGKEHVKCGHQNDNSTNKDSPKSEKNAKSKGTLTKDYKCHHCAYTDKGPANMTRHYAIDHQLWWTEDCPEGMADKSALANIIKIKKFLNCTKCNKKINFATYYHSHFEWCGRENLTYTCEYCNKENLVLRWQNIHLKTCPGLSAKIAEEKKMEGEALEEEEDGLGRGSKRKAAKKAMSMVHNLSKETNPYEDSDHSDNDPDAVIPDEEEDEHDDDDDVDDEINEDESIGISEEEDDDIVDFDEDDGRTRHGGSGMVGKFCIYFNPCPLMEKFVLENWSEELFTEWLPWKTDWQELSHEESKPYLPPPSRSMRFSFGKEKPTSLELLQTKKIGGSPLLYTGLTVWQVAWCPMSLKCTDVQYLAVTGKIQHSDPFFTDEQHTSHGLIQIWDTGICSNKNETAGLAKLSYNIVQDFGLVTKMVWCPSGCYQTNRNQVNKDAYTRLGLLAVSYTDGTCRIFSLPLLPAADGQVRTYRPKPVLTLIPFQNYAQHDITCSSVDWVKSSRHSKILAGYSDGAVRVFNLYCRSPLQYLETCEGVKLLPYVNLQPHGNLVRAVSFCSTFDTVIVTSSEDFETYFWDLNNLGSPLHDDGGFYMTVCMCTSLWQHGVYLGCDDNYAYLTNKGRYIESGHLMYSGKPERRKEERGTYYISSQPACIWGIDCSDWLGFVAACDNRGYICGLLLRDFIKYTPDCKSYKYRQVLLKTKVEEDCLGEDEKKKDRENTQLTENCKKNNEDTGVTETKQKKEYVSESCDRNGQAFSTETISQTEHTVDESKARTDNDYHALANRSVLCFEEHHKVAKYLPEDKHSDSYNRPSVAAIKSLSFNPNHRQCCWLAYGGNSGLVRIVNLQKILAVNTQAYMRDNKYL